MTDQPKPPTVAAELVQAAVTRLEEQGLIERAGEEQAAILNGDGMRTLLDLVTLWNIHTQGDQVPPDWQLSHDTGVAFQQALHLCLFADAEASQLTEHRRRTVQALRRAARKHKQ